MPRPDVLDKSDRGASKGGRGPMALHSATDPVRYDWWNSPPATRGSDMLGTARRVNEKQSGIRDQMLYWARMHGGVELANLTPTTYARPAVTVSVGENVGLNVIENMCSAAQAEACASKPKVTFATEDGDWYKQQEAEKLTRFCDGQAFEVGLHEIRREMILDACWSGTGIVKIFEDMAIEKVAVERIFPWELLIDRADAFYGRPMCVYQVKYMDRETLKRCYPKLREEIHNATGEPMGMGRDPFIYDTTADLVQVVEGWRKPTAPGRDDGRHIIAINDVTLLDEAWTREPPFVFLKWLKRPFGFWGKGLTEQLAGIQKEINRLLLKIQRAFSRLGITRIYIERGSKVNPAHMRSNDGDIVEYTGQKPVTETQPSVHPEIFNHLWNLERKAYEITGISQMSAQGQAPPPGVDSGRAIRTVLREHSKRFNEFGQQDEEAYVEINRQMIAVARDIANREVDVLDEDDKPTGKTKKHGYVVQWMTGTGMESIDMGDITLEDDEYIMRPFPTSALPDEPGERMQTVQEWFNTGMIDASMAQMLMDLPETSQFTSLNPQVALYKSVFKRLTDILQKGKAWTPDTFVTEAIGPDGRPFALSIAVPFLLQAETKGAPPDRLDLIRQCIEDMMPGNDNAGAAPGAGAGAPPGMPDATGGPQLPPAPPGALPPQVSPIGPMANPMQPHAPGAAA